MTIAYFLLVEISERTVDNPIPTSINNTLDNNFLIMVTIKFVKTINEATSCQFKTNQLPRYPNQLAKNEPKNKVDK
jgi:hypothetical protein